MRDPNSILCFIFVIFWSLAAAVSFNDSCNSSSPPCESLLFIVAAANASVDSIAHTFSVDPISILAANGFAPSKQDVIFRKSQIVAVPVTCNCDSRRGVHEATATYTVVAGDTLSAIATDKYFKLVTFQEIADASQIPDPNTISVGEKLTIPLPCACHSNSTSNNVYASYAVQKGDTFQQISQEFGTTTGDLENLNKATNLTEGQVIQIPVKACSSGTQFIPAGSYATFANCVQCSCSKNDTKLQCSRAPLSSPTCLLKCANSTLDIGQVEKQTSNGKCNVRSCLFDGLSQDGTILTRIQLNTTSTPCNVVPSPPTFAYAPIESIAGAPLASSPSGPQVIGGGPSSGMTPNNVNANAAPPVPSSSKHLIPNALLFISLFII